MLSVLAGVAIVAFVVTIVLGVLSGVRQTSGKTRTSSTKSTRETIRRHSEYVQIINESDDGYGVAAVESDGGISIKSFNANDEVFQSVWLRADELAPMADALSEHACEKRRNGELKG